MDSVPVSFPVAPYLDGDTTMVPLRALSECLGFQVVWKDASSPVTCTKDGTSIELRLGDDDVLVDGKALRMPKAAYLKDGTTVVPLRFFSEALGFQVSWDDATKTADVRSGKGPLQVWGFYALGSAEYSSWEDLFGQKYPYPLMPTPSSPASGMAGAILGWFAIDSRGLITTQGHPSGFARPDGWEAVLMRLSLFGAKKVAMFFADNQAGSLSSILNDPSARERLALNISLASVGFDGVALDFEGLGPERSGTAADSANFTAFVEAVKRQCAGRFLMTVLPPQNGLPGGYDHKALGKLSDAVVLMAYGYEDPAHPSSTAPWAKVDEAVALEIRDVPKEKIILGIPAYGTVYREQEEKVFQESHPAARDPVGHGKLQVTFDPWSISEVLSWTDGSGVHTAYLESNRTLQARVSLAERYGLLGAAVWRLGLLNQGWWDAVVEAVQPVR